MLPRHSKWTVVVAALAIVCLSSCGDDDESSTAPPATNDEFAMVAELGDRYFTEYTTPDGNPVNITAAGVWGKMTDADSSNDFVILDWRSATHFAAGHIEGAENVSITNFQNVVAGLNTGGKTVLNVCYTGQTASHATAYMNMLGIEAQNLKFGMCGWTSDTAINLGKWDDAISDDYADWLVTAATTSTQTYDYPVLNTGEATAEEILMASAQEYVAAGWKTINIATLYQDVAIDGNADDYFIVNYFNTSQYDAGHIPGAVRFQPKQDFATDALLSTLPTDKKIVVYCFTGQTSSQVVAYLNAIGYDAYSLVFGVNAICHSNGAICTTAYHTADTDFPVTLD